VPCRFGDTRKHALPATTHIEKLDDRSRVSFGQQIDKPPASTDAPCMANGIASVDNAGQIGVEIPAAVADVL
jgi:hypothetical protein